MLTGRGSREEFSTPKYVLNILNMLPLEKNNGGWGLGLGFRVMVYEFSTPKYVLNILNKMPLSKTRIHEQKRSH